MNPEELLQRGRGFGNRFLARKYGVAKNALKYWRMQVAAAVKEYGDIDFIRRNQIPIKDLYYSTNVHEFCHALGGIRKAAARGIILILKSQGVIKKSSREDLIREFVKLKPSSTPKELMDKFGLKRTEAARYIANNRNGRVLSFIAANPQATPNEIARKFGIKLEAANSLVGWFKRKRKS
jgi:transcriptional regulator of acetoin/glycerol metabolism